VEFSRDVVHKLVCPKCKEEEERFAPVGSIRFEEGRCPRDGQQRIVVTLHNYSGESDLSQRRLDTLGLPLFDVFTARAQDREIAYLLAGDEQDVLASLALERREP
jgi:hypothetical protein